MIMTYVNQKGHNLLTSFMLPAYFHHVDGEKIWLRKQDHS